MILLFPNTDVLQLALTSGIVPEDVWKTDVSWARSNDGTVAIEPSVVISRALSADLKTLGVVAKRKIDASLEAASSWCPLLRIVPSGEPEVTDQTEVLFCVPQVEKLPELVSEVLRLGNDRQHFRTVCFDQKEVALLRVTGPPYYSLLRAIDPVGESHPIAYVQQSPRVWVPIGFEHPLADHLIPPPGTWLIIDSQSQWHSIDESGFRDVYEVIDFELPHSLSTLEPTEHNPKIEVTLQLARGSSSHPAELWVINENPIEQIERMFSASDDRIISQLAFAVSHDDAGHPTVILRLRPSRMSPPILVLDATPCRAYLRIPNLFVPSGWHVHPPLQRDTIMRLLSSDDDQIHWLLPDPHDSARPERRLAGFQIQSIADRAFRPLESWVDYVLDRSGKSLDAWVGSFQFQFDAFECPEEEEQRRPKKKKRDLEPESPGSVDDDEGSGPSVQSELPLDQSKDNQDEPATQLVDDVLLAIEPSELQQRLNHLTQQFMESQESLDAEGRLKLWKQMGPINASLGNRVDTTICFSNALWNASPSLQDAAQWLRCEEQCSDSGQLTAESLDKFLSESQGRYRDSGLLAAALLWAEACDDVPEWISSRLQPISVYLVNQENVLPIRTLWLAWSAYYRLSDHDVLALARARDRILQRLAARGMTPEYDMASFMRRGATQDDGRQTQLRGYMASLGNLITDWVRDSDLAPGARTTQYAKLIFAYALARLGEPTLCRTLVEQAAEELDQSDSIHGWVLSAYKFRIRQALAGDTNRGPLDDEQLQILELMDRMDRYKVDRLRQQSLILEPHERIHPYRQWHRQFRDALAKRLAQLHDVIDPDQLRGQLREMLHEEREPDAQVRFLSTALELSMRLEEAFAIEVIQLVPAAIDAGSSSIDKALVLQKAIFVAAHYGHIDAVQQFIELLEAWLPEIVKDYLQVSMQDPQNKEKIDTLEGLFTQSFRGMRKLGMREEIGRLYSQVAGQLDANNATPSDQIDGDPCRRERLLLSVAGGWYYFGEVKSAEAMANKVRDQLLAAELSPQNRRNLACSYISAVSQAPITIALARINELFEVHVSGNERKMPIDDNMTTSSHFSISQLNVIESVISSLISDDFSLDADARRWLDEEEFLVRSRIHRDMQTASQSTVMG